VLVTATAANGKVNELAARSYAVAKNCAWRRTGEPMRTRPPSCVTKRTTGGGVVVCRGRWWCGTSSGQVGGHAKRKCVNVPQNIDAEYRLSSGRHAHTPCHQTRVTPTLTPPAARAAHHDYCRAQNISNNEEYATVPADYRVADGP